MYFIGGKEVKVDLYSTVDLLLWICSVCECVTMRADRAQCMPIFVYSTTCWIFAHVRKLVQEATRGQTENSNWISFACAYPEGRQFTSSTTPTSHISIHGISPWDNGVELLLWPALLLIFPAPVRFPPGPEGPQSGRQKCSPGTELDYLNHTALNSISFTAAEFYEIHEIFIHNTPDMLFSFTVSTFGLRQWAKSAAAWSCVWIDR